MFYKLVSCHAILFCLYFLRAQLRIENVWNIFSYNVFWGSHIDILLFTNCIFLICFVAFAFIEELQPMWGTRNSMKGCNKWFSLPGPQGYFQSLKWFTNTIPYRSVIAKVLWWWWFDSLATLNPLHRQASNSEFYQASASCAEINVVCQHLVALFFYRFFVLWFLVVVWFAFGLG